MDRELDKLDYRAEVAAMLQACNLWDHLWFQDRDHIADEMWANGICLSKALKKFHDMACEDYDYIKRDKRMTVCVREHAADGSVTMKELKL